MDTPATFAASKYSAQHAAARETALKAGDVIRNSRDRAQAKVKSGVDLVTEVDQEVERIVKVTPESVLLDPTSPQYSAMQWLLDDID